MDNSKVHTSNKWMEYLNSLSWRSLFLSPYSPEYAPIVLLFNHLKQKLSYHWKDLVINLNKKEGLRQIKEWLAAIDKSTIISFWIHSMQIVKKTINKEEDISMSLKASIVKIWIKVLLSILKYSKNTKKKYWDNWKARTFIKMETFNWKRFENITR